MYEFKGTPGPWDYGWRVQPNGCPTVGHNGLMVCMVAHSAKVADQRETALANASLISAAPELLEALQDLKREVILSDVDMDYIDSHFKPWLDKARKAIAKALASNT